MPGDAHPAQGAYEHGSQTHTPAQTPETTRKPAGKAPPPVLSTTEAHKKGWFGKK